MRYFVFAVIFFSACLGKPVSPKLIVEPKSSSSPVVHVVKNQAETLQDLSRWYTGSSLNSQVIAKYNGKLKLEKLTVGESILIPENLVKTRKPFLISKADSRGKAPDKKKLEDKKQELVRVNSEKAKVEKSIEPKKSDKDKKESKVENKEEIKKPEEKKKEQSKKVQSKIVQKKSQELKEPISPNSEKQELEKDERKLDELRYQYLQELGDL